MNDAAFGTDPTMTVDDLARAIKTIKVDKTPTSKLGDVIEIIEHLRDHALSLHDETVKATERLAERQREIEKRERELALRQKAVDAVLKGKPQRSWF